MIVFSFDKSFFSEIYSLCFQTRQSGQRVIVKRVLNPLCGIQQAAVQSGLQTRFTEFKRSDDFFTENKKRLTGDFMKKVLGIVASPRKIGNSEMMIKEIGKHIPVPCELKLLRLSDFDIKPCRACYTCLFKEEHCVIKDDLHKITEAIAEADGLIVAAPTYFLGANALLKLLLDRGLSFYSYLDRFWGKPSVGIGIAGIDGKEGYTLLNIRSFLKLTMTDIKMTGMIYGALPGEIFFNEENKQIAAAMGKALFGERLETKAPSCPLCGGDTFQFIGDNRVKCMLCSNPGTVETKDGRPVFSIGRAGHELFLSKEEALQHRDWLRQMKGRFSEEKSRLKEISSAYLKGWEFIKP